MSLAPVASASRRKRLGAYYTPAHIVEYLVRWAVRQSDDRVLEPACGEAAFLTAAADRLRGLGGESIVGQLVGYELDPDATLLAKEAESAAVVIEGDFFEQQPNEHRFDAVVGNPPYVRYHYFLGQARERGLERARAAGVRLSGLTSSWAPFVIHAAAFLQARGRLALVLPAELLVTDYAGPVRQYLLRRFGSIDVITFEARVFPGAMVDAVLLLAEGQGPGRLRVHRLPDAAALTNFSPSGQGIQLSGKWTSSLLEDDALQALETANGKLISLGDLTTVDIGIVTGANSFFVLSDTDARQHGLYPPVLRRLVARAYQMRGYIFADSDWEAQRQAGTPVWLFAPRTNEGAAGRYISLGEAQSIGSAYKCRVRKPWWRFRVPEPPDLFLNYMSNQAPQLVVNVANALSTNLIHNVRLSRAADHVMSARLLALAWNNSATMLSCETTGRAYGGGVLKLETREAERVIFPDLTAAAAERLYGVERQVDAALRNGDVETAADLVDPIVLSHLSTAKRASLRRGWRDLRTRRKQRSSPARDL